jgi:hypothetical protein
MNSFLYFGTCCIFFLRFFITSMTTVGYSDVVPLTNFEKLIALLGYFCGILFMSLPNLVISEKFLKMYLFERNKGSFSDNICLNDDVEESN